MIDLRDRSVLVLGLGITGVSAARFCAERGARVVVAEERSDVDPGELPAGIYEVWADFGDGLSAHGTGEVLADTEVIVKCNRMRYSCTVD